MKNIVLFLVQIFALLSVTSSSAFASAYNPDDLSILWGLPFAFILLSIAFLPLITGYFWHTHYGKVTLIWMICLILPFGFVFGAGSLVHLLSHAMLEEYLPFILLLLALFVVSGGILIDINCHATPKFNVMILALGTFLASIMGTTGAAMLLIRPLLKANNNRKHRVHTVIFFIFLVANIGGGLTPIGDPPLFIGFLKGINFFWTVEHMLLPVLFSSMCLLTLYFVLDSYFFRKEAIKTDMIPLKIEITGKQNFILLAAIIGSVLMSGIWKSNISFSLFGAHLYLQDIVRNVLFLVITLTSIAITSKQIRANNDFNYEPIIEVAKLFIGIFITIAPVIAILQAGQSGALSGVLDWVNNSQGEPNNVIYFWLTGMLSGFLDNAPTYLVFFNLATGDAHFLIFSVKTLLAISMGSVFMGALTYIGNAPNFMVKSIAEQTDVAMPSFFGYMKWSILILIPMFIIETFIFF